MSTQPPLPRGDPQEPLEPKPARCERADPSERPDAQIGRGVFRRRFLELQLVFLVFILIASIPEPPSPYSRLSAPVQVVMIVILWILSDAAALVVRTAQVLRRRADR